MSNMLFSASIFSLDFLLGELGYLACKAVGNFYPFPLCLEHGVTPISEFPLLLSCPHGAEVTGYGCGTEHDGAQGLPVQRPGVMSEPSSGGDVSTVSWVPSLSSFHLHISSLLPPKVLWDSRKRRGP